MRQNSTYLVLALSLIVLSASGAYIFLRPSPQVLVNDSFPPYTTPTPAQTFEETSPTSVISVAPTAILPTPTSTTQVFTSDVDNFTVTFSSSRKLYQDKESTGNRYTLYSSQGNIAIHIGKNWSWTYPDRVFTTDFLVANQPTFVYDISNQTITDFQSNGKDYTFQCVHNGISEIKTECQKILSEFKFNH